MLPIYLLSEPQNHRCCYCGHRMIEIPRQPSFTPRNAMTREHFIPRSYQGVGKENLVAACRQCNEMRGNMDAIAFYNLLQKWFKRDETLWERWHHISTFEYRQFKLRCLQTQERHLRGMGQRHPVYAERHSRFMLHNEVRLRA